MLEDLRIRNYAPSTVTCYVRAVTQFAKHFNQSPDHLGPEGSWIWQRSGVHAPTDFLSWNWTPTSKPKEHSPPERPRDFSLEGAGLT